jgi:hypothetical protein
MARLPKPLIGLLLGAVAFLAVWMVALKPSSSSSDSSQGAGASQTPIVQAHPTVTTSHTVPAVKHAPAAKATPAAKPAASTGKRAASKPSTPSVASEVQTVQNAVRANKVVAVLFYNSAAADDQAMKHELASVATHGGQVVRLAVPVSQLTQFGMITTQVPVVSAPTLVVIDKARQATTIMGFAAPAEISQRIADALAGN